MTKPNPRVSPNAAVIERLRARAEAAEKELHELTEGYRGELESLEVLADARERDHNDFRLENDREWKARVDHQKARAEAAEKRVKELEDEFVKAFGDDYFIEPGAKL